MLGPTLHVIDVDSDVADLEASVVSSSNPVSVPLEAVNLIRETHANEGRWVVALNFTNVRDTC